MRAGAGREGRGAPDDKEGQRGELEVGSEKHTNPLGRGCSSRELMRRFEGRGATFGRDGSALPGPFLAVSPARAAEAAATVVLPHHRESGLGSAMAS